MQDRRFAMLLGRWIEEAAVLRIEPGGSRQADLSLHSTAAGRSLSCAVCCNFPNDTSLPPKLTFGNCQPKQYILLMPMQNEVIGADLLSVSCVTQRNVCR
jgi:hypothetical protein